MNTNLVSSENTNLVYEALAAYWLHLVAQGLAETTATRYSRTVAQFADWAQVDARTATADDIRRWLTRPMSPETRSAYFYALARWFAWLAATGLREGSPMADLRLRKGWRRGTGGGLA